MANAEETLRRRLERERRARHEAESIAERVTADLYAAIGELERLNAALGEANRGLEAANESIKEFVAVASHDLRSPLTVMVGSTQLLLQRFDDLSEQQRLELLRSVAGAGLRAERLIDDLLTVSRLEAGVVVAHLEDISIGLELERVVSDFADEAVKIQVVPAPPDLLVYADADHVHRILCNYVSNALKYGEPPVEVSADDRGDFVEVRIADRGDGVPEEFAHRLFAKFARAEQAATKAEGTGLGLSIVLGLARANGGDAWYEPNIPRGSCFAVKLPKCPQA